MKDKKNYKDQLKTKDLTKMGLFVALLSVSAYITIPIGVVPLTLQTLMINLIALLLTPFQAFITVFAYILLGSIGLPVFSGAAGGLGKLFGPTGGFIMAFLIAAPIISYLTGKLGNALRKTKILSKWQEKNQNISSGLVSSILITILVGMSIIYVIGVLYMNFSLGWTLEKTLTVAVFPFIPLDIFKCVVASLLAVSIKRIIKNF